MTKTKKDKEKEQKKAMKKLEKIIKDSKYDRVYYPKAKKRLRITLSDTLEFTVLMIALVLAIYGAISMIAWAISN